MSDNNLYQKFLTRYPLLWNTRAFVMIPALLLLHLLFYLSGLFSISNLAELDDFRVRSDGDTWGLSVMISVLTLVLWLVFYLRNNAFKSFYPLPKGRLLSEFLLLIVIVFLAISFPFTHQQGREDGVIRVSKNVDAVKEINTANLAQHFLPYDYDDFAVERSCDTLARYGEYSDRYVPDSVPREHSYLHYCRQAISSDRKGVLNQFELDAIAEKWLREGKKDSVTAVIEDYLAMVRKYGGDYRFNAEKHVQEIFSTPRFLVTGRLSAYGNENTDDEYVGYFEVNRALSNVSMVYLREDNSDMLLVLSYFAVCFALLIFSFRITKLRTWFIALIAMGVYLILFSVMLGMGMAHTPEAAGALFILVSLLCLAFSIFSIRSRTSKLYAGIGLLFFTWTLPSLLPIFGVLQEDHSYKPGHRPGAFARWIDDHWPVFMTVNLFIVLIITSLVIIPLARKWQACPEE